MLSARKTAAAKPAAAPAPMETDPNRILLGDEVFSIIDLWESQKQGAKLLAWQQDVLTKTIDPLFEKVVNNWRSDPKCRMQASFSRPPKSEELTMSNVVIIAKILPALVAELKAAIATPLLETLNKMAEEILGVAQKLRLGADEWGELENRVRARKPGLEGIQLQGEELKRVKDLRDFKIQMITKVEVMMNEVGFFYIIINDLIKSVLKW
jgi:hypothetical protein